MKISFELTENETLAAINEFSVERERAARRAQEWDDMRLRILERIGEMLPSLFASFGFGHQSGYQEEPRDAEVSSTPDPGTPAQGIHVCVDIDDVNKAANADIDVANAILDAALAAESARKVVKKKENT